MKKYFVVISNVSILLVVLSYYAGVVKPRQRQFQKSTQKIQQLSQQNTLQQQRLTQLTQSLRDLPALQNTNMQQLIRTVTQLAKQQHVAIQQLQPITQQTTAKPLSVLSIKCMGQFQQLLAFIKSINQLPFLLHWQSVALTRRQSGIELKLNIAI